MFMAAAGLVGILSLWSRGVAARWGVFIHRSTGHSSGSQDFHNKNKDEKNVPVRTVRRRTHIPAFHRTTCCRFDSRRGARQRDQDNRLLRREEYPVVDTPVILVYTVVMVALCFGLAAFFGHSNCRLNGNSTFPGVYRVQSRIDVLLSAGAGCASILFVLCASGLDIWFSDPNRRCDCRFAALPVGDESTGQTDQDFVYRTLWRSPERPEGRRENTFCCFKTC